MIIFFKFSVFKQSLLIHITLTLELIQLECNTEFKIILMYNYHKIYRVILLSNNTHYLKKVLTFFKFVDVRCSRIV